MKMNPSLIALAVIGAQERLTVLNAEAKQLQDFIAEATAVPGVVMQQKKTRMTRKRRRSEAQTAALKKIWGSYTPAQHRARVKAMMNGRKRIYGGR